MSKSDYIYDGGSKFPIKYWTNGVDVATNAKQQLSNLANMPFIFKHVAVMPDVHLGKGCSIGTVLATKEAVIPAAAGVDLGCGISAVKLSLTANQLPDSLSHIRGKIESAIPHGRSDNGGVNDKGGWGNKIPSEVEKVWNTQLSERYDDIIQKHPKAKAFNTYQHLCSLGTGNHYWELCLDECDDVWVMLHSGSRGAGNRIGGYFIEKAKEEMLRYHITDYLPDQDLSYLVEHTTIYDDYIEAVQWAQDYAAINRSLMMDRSLKVLSETLPPFMVVDEAINCHHNYISKENHFGENVLITRKGAVSAREGQLGVIPGSMGTKSFIVRGKGNKESFCSCSHGAGRVMSRNEAKKKITLEQHEKAMKGIEARLDEGVLDESPSAYKDPDSVIKAQDSLVDVVHTLRQIVNVKG